MFKFLHRNKAAPKPAVNIDEIPRYPPFQLGLPATPVDLLMESQRELLLRIYDSIGLALDEDDRFIKPLIRRYCEYVHLLPASQAHHHRGSGGLFRHGLEVGIAAVRKSRNYVYGMEYEPQVRRRVKIKWRVGMFVAGLCHDVGKPKTDLRVTDKAGDRVWNPLHNTLANWLDEAGIERYFLHWTKGRHGKHEGVAPHVLPKIMKEDLSIWLTEDGDEVLEFIGQAISGMNPQDRNMRLVIDADQQSVERDLSENQIDPYSLALGVPVEQHLIDAMRRLTRAEEWTVNRPGARIWIFDGHVHLVWPGAAEDIIATLAGDKVNGIPKSPKILADILIDRKLAIGRPVPDSLPRRFWRIAPAALERGGRRIALNMLRLAPECKLFPGPFPESVGYTLAAATDDRYTGVKVAPGSAPPKENAPPETDAEPIPPPDAVPVGASAPVSEPSAEPEPSPENAADESADAVEDETVAVSASTEDRTDETPSETPEIPDGKQRFSAAQARDWLAHNDEKVSGVLTLLVSRNAPRFDSEGYALIDYPDEFESAGVDPLESVLALDREGMLIHDPVNPLGKLHQRDGRRVIILIQNVSRRLFALCPPAGAAGPGPSAPSSEPSPKPSSVPAPDDTAAAGDLVRRLRAADESIPFDCSRLRDGTIGVDARVIVWYAEKYRVNALTLNQALMDRPDCTLDRSGARIVVKALN